jgi:predicted small lipoprotein YifL
MLREIPASALRLARFLLFGFAAALALLLAGCGIKGPLKLPPAPASAVPPVTPPGAAPAPAPGPDPAAQRP